MLTATTSSCTGCRCSSLKRSRRCGTPGCGPSWASGLRTPTTSAASSSSSTAAPHAWGYLACPAVEDQTKVAQLLDWGRIGVELSEEFMLQPEQSTSAIIAHHREAKYFAAR